MSERTMMTLLTASRDQGIESFHLSLRMRRATSRRNALTSSPVSAASDTYRPMSPVVGHAHSQAETAVHCQGRLHRS